MIKYMKRIYFIHKKKINSLYLVPMFIFQQWIPLAVSQLKIKLEINITL